MIDYFTYHVMGKIVLFLIIGTVVFIIFIIRKIQSFQNKNNNEKLVLQLKSGNFNPLDLIEELNFLVQRKKLNSDEIPKVINILDSPPSTIDIYEILVSKKIATDAYLLVTNCHTEDFVPVGNNKNESFSVIENINFLFRIKAEEVEVYSFLVYKELRLKNLQLNFCMSFFEYVEKVENLILK